MSEVAGNVAACCCVSACCFIVFVLPILIYGVGGVQEAIPYNCTITDTWKQPEKIDNLGITPLDNREYTFINWGEPNCNYYPVKLEPLANSQQSKDAVVTDKVTSGVMIWLIGDQKPERKPEMIGQSSTCYVFSHRCARTFFYAMSLSDTHCCPPLKDKAGGWRQEPMEYEGISIYDSLEKLPKVRFSAVAWAAAVDGWLILIAIQLIPVGCCVLVGANAFGEEGCLKIAQAVGGCLQIVTLIGGIVYAPQLFRIWFFPQ